MTNWPRQIVCVLPARSGSKRIVGKNTIDLFGQPMIYWPIVMAKKSGLFDEVIVSTDSLEIASVATKSGATVPFIRDKNLADDFTGTDDVIVDAISQLSLNDTDIVCCLYPTAVLLNPAQLIESFSLILENTNSFIYSVAKYSHPVERRLHRMADGSLEFVETEYLGTRTQDLPDHYYDAGQFYWATVETWKSQVLNHRNRILGYILNTNDFVDIDSKKDLDIVKYHLKNRSGKY
jgi:pseudaminic acid cytidylyltransferase